MPSVPTMGKILPDTNEPQHMVHHDLSKATILSLGAKKLYKLSVDSVQAASNQLLINLK